MSAQVHQWQESSLIELTQGPEQAFMTVVSSIPPGRRFTVNDIRGRLDAAEIPADQRGALFNRAIAAGLIHKVTVSAWGIDYPVRVRSTGSTAHSATVRVYRRTEPPPVGALS